MSSLFKKNAYHVLGLDIGSNQRVIKKRADEIIRFLKIDKEQEYETDLPILKATRTEASVKESVQKLTSPTKRIKEYFFWFDINDSLDKKALQYVRENKLKSAIDIWLQKGKKDNASALVAKKNLAILVCLSLIENDTQAKLKSSIGLWEEIVKSDKFWVHFTKVYKLNDETGISDGAIEEFRLEVIDDLSDFYAELSSKHGNNSYYSEFAKKFKARGQRIEQEVLGPIYESINETSELLRKLNISEDEIFSEDEARELKRLSDVLSENFDKLKGYGLYDESKSKTMRDAAAEAIRTVSIDLYNNLNESAIPAALLKTALSIAGTAGTKSKINKDIDIVTKNISDEKLIRSVNKLIEEEKFEEALEKSEELAKHSKDQDQKNFFYNRIRLCVASIAVRDYKIANDNLDNKQMNLAAQKFEDTKSFIKKYIEYFNYDQDSVDKFVSDLEVRASGINADNVSGIDEYRNNTVNSLKENFSEEEFGGAILIILVDCYIYGAFAIVMQEALRKKRNKNIIGWSIAIGVFIVIVLFGGSSSSTDSDSTGSSSSSSAYDTCITEMEALKTKLDSIEAQMKTFENADNDAAYNQLVPQQNQLVTQYNEKIKTCKNLR